MRPEAHLLLHASRARITSEHSATLREITARVRDWEWVRRTADWHAVIPLLHRQLQAAAPPQLPPLTADALRAAADESSLRSFVLARHLATVVAALEERGVPVIPLKGPVLALAVYGDLALRRFGDLDILVPRERVPDARDALRALGYSTATRFSSDAERALARSDYHVRYALPGAGVKVELHWSLTREVAGTHVSERWAWANSRELDLLGRTVTALRDEALLVYLCIHGSKHGWGRLAWICDVAELLRGAGATMKWDVVAELARECGARRMVPLGLALARELLDAPVPADAARLLPETARVRALVAEVRARLFDDAWDGESGLLGFQLRTRERLHHRAAYLLHLLTAPHVADVESVPLPAALRPLYRVVRPVRLLSKRLRVKR
ncbi:MAG TPA: nucleotidyltransferase family protein [Gemmatimonadaceae bacterium]|nr:nucleotidyltransferase family protein [Gemmatimonadaceae bacterium]